MEKPTLLIYCQHSLGMGHLVRSFRLAEALRQEFRTVFINGGLLPDAPPPPAGVEIEQLPPIGMGPGGGLISRDPSLDLENAMVARRDRLLQLLSVYQPSVLLLELFPFGRRKFQGELIPLLEAAKGLAEPPLILTSLRDLLVQHPEKQSQHERFALDVVNAYIDAVLIHADPAFAKLEESFAPADQLSAEIHYTGFVAPKSVPGKPLSPPNTILVSAGSGTVGGPLFSAALVAQPILLEKTGLSMTVIAGPFLDEELWQTLAEKAEGLRALTLLRSVPDMTAELGHAALSISQCGYNTVMDLLAVPVPALVVPFFTPKENEQINRARRLQDLGVAQFIHPEALSAKQLAEEALGSLAADAVRTNLDCEGSDNTLNLITRLLARRRSDARICQADEPCNGRASGSRLAF